MRPAAPVPGPQGLRRLRLDGRRVAVVDAGRVLPDADPGDGEVVEDRAQR